jgi:uncharacterized protein YecE (DUF72 family)
MQLFIGTSGYSYPAWKGKFYPKGIRATEMLRFYQDKFRSVEINNTFYKMPTATLIRSWYEGVDGGFQFAVKAPQQITHHQRLVASARTLSSFIKASDRFAEKRGPLLFQLPPNFQKDLDRLTKFLKHLPSEIRAAFEFRHPSWFSEDVYEVLRNRNLALCIAEDEKLATPPVATADWGYLRLRREDYKDNDVRQWAAKIAQQNWQSANVYFKHEDSAQGPKLAAFLQSLMSR